SKNKSALSTAKSQDAVNSTYFATRPSIRPRRQSMRPTFSTIGCCRCLKAMVYRCCAFRKIVFQTIDDLQRELDIWIDHYNGERTHQVKMCCGKTPMETLIDGKKVWLDKKIDQI
ncbi:MAG: hypothetical protein K5905_14090, partial [Roseibium sp.]|nr:hypothetical protein [Roseibium sp.]